MRRLSLSQAQTAGDLVRVVIGLSDRLFDARSQRFAHVTVLINYRGNGRDADLEFFAIWRIVDMGWDLGSRIVSQFFYYTRPSLSNFFCGAPPPGDQPRRNRNFTES